MALDDDFDAAFARAVTAGLLSEAELDTITDSIAAGQATERSALCDWWPAMEVAFGQDFPWQPTPPTTLPQTFSLAGEGALRAPQVGPPEDLRERGTRGRGVQRRLHLVQPRDRCLRLLGGDHDPLQAPRGCS